MNQRFRVFCTMLVLVVSGWVLSACSTPPTPPVVSATSTAPVVTRQETTVVQTVPTATPAAPKPTAPPVAMALTIDVGPTWIDSLDPLQWKSTLEKSMLDRTIYNELIQREPNMQFAPGLALSWNVAADGITWTMNLRKGVKFHDGTDFNAQAVKFSLDRIRDTKGTSSQRFAFNAAIKDIVVVDDNTVQIVTKGPYAVLPALLSGWGGAIVSPSAVTKFGKDFATKAAGTGPFKVQSFGSGEPLVLVRNDDYWGPKPQLTRVKMLSIKEDAARTASLKTGEIDVTIGVPDSQLAFLKQDTGIQLVQTPSVRYEYLAFNTSKAPTSDVKLRRALAQAIDAKGINDALSPGQYQNYCAPLVGPLMFGYEADPGCIKFDPAAAKKALTDLGFQSQTITFNYYDTPRYRQLAEILQSYLKDVGVTLNLERTDYATLNDKIAKGQTQFWISQFGNSSGDPVPSLVNVFMSSSIGANNTTAYKNADYDKLMTQAQSELDEGKRRSLIQQAVRIVVADSPHISLGSSAGYTAYTKFISGWQVHPLGDFILDSITVSK